ncbi:hypothetical protein [Pseudomonas phage PIP]|nr:hypothetical protein [Pseudomonas phage PIP]
MKQAIPTNRVRQMTAEDDVPETCTSRDRIAGVPPQAG